MFMVLNKMTEIFDYKKAKDDAERMLEVIERDPQAPRWTDQVQSLVPMFYNIAITTQCLAISTKALKRAGIFDLNGNLSKS
jgi:hypothetical protein